MKKEMAICIDNKWYQKSVTLGKVYEIERFAAYTARELARFIDDDGAIQYLASDRFKTINEEDKNE